MKFSMSKLHAQKSLRSNMKSFPFHTLLLLPLFLSLHFHHGRAASAHKHETFLQCLSINCKNISNLVYTPTNPSYSSIFNFSVRNFRFFSTPTTSKPLAIITPSHVVHIQAAVICSKNHGLQILTRSGGHDTEGLSYISYLPFIIIDLINLRSITIDVENNTASVQSGATLGELYYKIAERSRTFAFPAGICPTVGIGGHLSGGGYGYLLRKYGLAADNVIGAYLVDGDGKFHDRESMGEDLFWAIRGGGGGSFGIVVAWKVKLVAVPTTVTNCRISKTLDQKTKKLIHRWQYVANKMDENLLVTISFNGGNSTQGVKRTQTAAFFSLFLGKAEELIAIMKETFPELELAKNDCIETSWIESVLIAAGFSNGVALEVLLNRTPLNSGSNKVKSDYVKEPISEVAFEGIWERLKAQDIEIARLTLFPYGGKMSEISEWESPLPHRAGFLYKIVYIVGWTEQSMDANERHLSWIRKIYDFMTPFVSKSPRVVYANYRDLDIGTNNKYGKTSYERASIWGLKYFGNNFNRLVHVKTKIDPHNFFRHEQSIPPL